MSSSGKLLATPALVTPITIATGFALANGTSTIVSYNVPAGGALHNFYIGAGLNVTSNETGGQLTITTTIGGQAYTITLFAAGLAAALYSAGFIVSCDASAQIAVKQATALTVGAASLSVAISGG